MGKDTYIVRRIEAIEAELRRLRQFMAGEHTGKTSLRGIWQGVDFSDEQIEEAKRSLFRDIELDDRK